ncbi:MAG: hypothetical protein ABJC65_03850, partial [Nitratireductor sp.]
LTVSIAAYLAHRPLIETARQSDRRHGARPDCRGRQPFRRARAALTDRSCAPAGSRGQVGRSASVPEPYAEGS